MKVYLFLFLIISGVLLVFNKSFFSLKNKYAITDSLKETKKNRAVIKGKEVIKLKEEKNDNEWRKILTPDQYKVLREKGTERPFSGEYWDNFENGIYKCAGCGEILFNSNTKFDAGCGWPSFYEAVDKSKIIENDDYSLGIQRVEVICKKCGGHLGHVFPDGPKPTGMRYCINSLSLKFERKGK